MREEAPVEVEPATAVRAGGIGDVEVASLEVRGEKDLDGFGRA